jgi:hypothetical protein
MTPMLTRTHPDDANVDPNSSEGVDPSSSAGVDPNSSEGVDTMSSEGVDTMLTETPAKLLSVPFLNMSCRLVVRWPKSRLPLELMTVPITAIAVITAISAIAAL